MSFGSAAYLASKAFVHSISQTAAIENAGKVRVNVVAPGVTISSLAGDSDESHAYQQSLAGKVHLIQRAAKPSEIAHWVVQLASDKASFVTGTIITLDGGGQLV